MSAPDSPAAPAPPRICGSCTYFRPIDKSQFGNCHGYPPTVEKGTSAQAVSVRPQVLPADQGCTLFAGK